MAFHQQKLVHIAELTNVAAAGNQAIATAFLINADNNPSLAVARHETTAEVYGADPGANARWWSTAITTAGFTFNWAGFAGGGENIHIVSHIFFSHCFDISSAQQQY